MRAALVESVAGTLTMRPGELPRPECAPDSVVVAVDGAGVNPVDLGNAADNGWSGVQAPYVVGYEFAGTVLEAGYAVANLEVGDEVWGLLPVRGTRWGAYAELVAAPAALVARRPESLTVPAAASLPLAGGTAIQVLDRLRLDAGAWLLVHGATGGVGHLLVQLAVRRGVNVVSAVRSDQTVRMRELGLAHQLSRDAENPAELAARDLGRPLDGVVDLVGGLLLPSLPYLVEGGQAATVVDLIGDLEDAVDRNLTIHGVLLRPGPGLLASLAEAVRDGVRPHVVETLPLAHAAAAHHRLSRGRVGGKLVVLTADHGS
jgi:NADPH:quinone reductase-like Zn-dependent oxidoreductase